MSKLRSYLICLIPLAFASCTINMTNASSNGKASDLIDQEQTASPDVKTDLSIPLIK